MSRNYNKVLMCTPIRGNSTVTLYTAGLLQSSGLHGGWLPMAGQSDIYVARNVLANEFLGKKEFDTLICVDSDIGFTRQNFQDLIESDGLIVSGLYTDKCQPPTAFCRDEEGNQVPLEDIPAVGMIRTGFVPGGFLKIEREAFNKIIASGLVPTYGPTDNFYQFYNGRIYNKNLLSEDYSFSWLARQAGIDVWMNCGIRLNHDGRTLDPQPPYTPNAPVKV